MTKITLTNVVDEGLRDEGRLEGGAVRTVELEALVDTAATSLVVPEEVMTQLGARPFTHRTLRFADGRSKRCPVIAVRVRAFNRVANIEAVVQGPGTDVLLGQIPLEALDLIVDPKSQEARVNPASPDEAMYTA
jgi:clan AA aspartic protease